MAEQKIRAIMIIEIAGRPTEHVQEVLTNHIEQFKSVKGIKLISSEINEPKKLEIEQEMYTCFAEVEVETESFPKLIDLIFDFMPSSVEIIEPTQLNFNLQEATMFLNTLSGRLHKYDEIAKVAQLQAQQLAKKLQLVGQEIADKEKKLKSKKKKK